MVGDAARRADDHVGATLQGVQLRGVALTAVDRQHVEAGQAAGVLLEGLGDLDREFAGRHHDEALRFALADVDHRQDRQCEGGGLAGAGLRLADDIVAGQHHRNDGGLDRGGGLVADVGQCRQDLGLEPQVGECARGRGRG